ncbi:MAG: CsgG/HfaB family protein [Nitrospiraceae bacterium]|nr:CsgG/HfaB family protein [Nitrospiraceae bacterium]
MKRVFLFFLVIALALSFAITTTSEAAKKKVAVLDFEYGTITDRWWPGSWNIGKGIADMMVTQLVKDGTYSVIERKKLDAIISEQKLGASGLVDASTAAQIGKILGVQYVIIGSITQFSIDTSEIGLGGIGAKFGFGGAGVSNTVAKVYIDARMIDTTTAEIIGVAEGKAEDSKKGLKLGGGNYKGFGGLSFASKGFNETILGQATRQCVADVVKQLTGKAATSSSDGEDAPKTVKVKIADIDAGSKTVILDGGSSTGISKGQTLYVVKVKKEIKSPTTGEVIKRITETVAELNVTEVDKTSATATIVKGDPRSFKAGDDVSSTK